MNVSYHFLIIRLLDLDVYIIYYDICSCDGWAKIRRSDFANKWQHGGWLGHGQDDGIPQEGQPREDHFRCERQVRI